MTLKLSLNEIMYVELKGAKAAFSNAVKEGTSIILSGISLADSRKSKNKTP